MRKIGIAVIMLFVCLSARADQLGDLIKTTLLERVSAVTQLDFDGSTKMAAVDSVILIGKYDGKSILHIQGGFNQSVDPESDESDTTDLIAGAQFRIDPFINAKLNLPEAWEFLRSLEHGPAAHYDFRTKDWFASYQIGLAFGLNPVK